MNFSSFNRLWLGGSFRQSAAATATLAVAASVAVTAFSLSNTPPASTATAAPASTVSTVSYNSLEVPPASTVNLAAAAPVASVAYGILEVPPARTASLAAGSSTSSVSFNSLEVPPTSTVTVAAASSAGSVSFSSTEVPPANTVTVAAASLVPHVAFTSTNTTPTPTPTATSSLTSLLNAVKAQIVASGLYTANQAAVTLDPDPWPTSGSSFCWVRPGSHNLIEGQWLGGGQQLAGYTGRIIVRVVDQMMRDEVGRDDYALLTQETGLMDRGLAVVEALTSDTAENALLEGGYVQRGLVPETIREPTRRHVSGKDNRWRGIDLVFVVQWTHVYLMD